MFGHTEFPVIPTHLIIVCCHGVYTGGPCKGASEDEWLIAPFQAGETPTFTAHMRLGLEILESDPSSVLILSGGPTRPETELSEATSYLQLGVDNGFWGYELSEREVLCEQRAMDSYHNVLYSLTRFFAHYETWPGRVTVVSHEFKKARIIEGHCAAIGLRNVGFAGIDPPAKSDPSALAQEKRGIQQALVDWQEDPHGRGPKLAGKRRQRNIHNTWQGIMPKDHNHSGGLITRGEDGEETLVDDAPRPWNT